MLNKILLNNAPLSITKDSLPCIISYIEKMGGSHFSVSYIADLFLSGSKILFLTAYPMATDNFIEQIKNGSQDFVKVDFKQDIMDGSNARAVIIKSGDEKLFIDSIELLDDINERVVFVKNIENFGKDTINKCLEIKNIIFSGNIDKCVLKREILETDFATTIFFSQPQLDIDFKLPDLEHYSAYMRSKDKNGIIRLSD